MSIILQITILYDSLLGSSTVEVNVKFVYKP